MKLYTSLEIPLWNWYKIQESYKNGSPDLKYLVKGIDYENPPKITDDLASAYLKIVYELPSVNIDLVSVWTSYLIEEKNYQVDNEVSLWQKLTGGKKSKIVKIDPYKYDRAFTDYMDALDEVNDSYMFNVFFLKKDFQDLWDYKEPIPKILIKESDDIEFFLADQYIGTIIEWLKSGDINLNQSFLMLSPEFYLKFIDVREQSFESVRIVYNILFKNFTDDLDKLRIIRGDYFHLNKMDFTQKSEDDILDQVIALREINNQTIDLHNTSLNEYYKQIKRAEKKEAERKKETKKPNSSG